MNKRHPSQKMLCGNLEKDLDIIVLVHFDPVNQCSNDQVLVLKAAAVVFPRPCEELVDLGLGGLTGLLCIIQLVLRMIMPAFFD